MSANAPIHITIQKLLSIVDDSDIPAEKKHEKKLSAIRWAVNARAKELHTNSRQLKMIFDAMHVDERISESTYRKLAEMGIRPEHLASFTFSLWHAWKPWDELRIYVGSHVAKLWNFDEPVASIHDILGMVSFMRYVESQVPDHAKIVPEFVMPELSASSSQQRLQQRIDQIDPKSLVENGAVFTFGSPSSNYYTGALSKAFFSSESLEPLPIFKLHHRSQQYSDSIFEVGPNRNKVQIVTRKLRKPVAELVASRTEDFGIAALAIDEHNIAFGFAAGLGALGTRAASYGLEALFDHDRLENVIETTNGDVWVRVAIVRVSTKDEMARNSYELIPRQNSITLFSKEQFGWNFISPAEFEKLDES